MRYPIVLLLLASYGTATSIGIYNSRGDGTAFHPNGRQNAQFFHRIGDWVRNAKNRIVNRVLGIDPAAIPGADETLGMDLLELQQRFREDGMIPLDISTLSLDPTFDFGFQVGDWYFIRKHQQNSSPNDENSSDEWVVYPVTTFQDSTTVMGRTTKPQFPQHDKTPGALLTTLPLLPLFTGVSIPSTLTQSTSQVSTQMASVSPTTIHPTPPSTVGKSVEDNELGNELPQPASVEVFM